MIRFAGLAASLLVLAACARPKTSGIEELGTGQELSMFKIGSVSGTRDGDRLMARVMWTDSSSILTMDMGFTVGPVTTLNSGAWRWTRSGTVQSGGIAARSVTFLGGQSGPPSLGGTFDLLNAAGGSQYRVRLPETELKTKLLDQRDWQPSGAGPKP